LLKDEEIADVMDANQNVQVKRGYLPKEAYLLLQEMQDECAKDVEAFTMRSHTDRFAQLRHDALWHQCHGFNWDLSGGELHIIADELNYWAMLLRLPLATYRNYEPLRTQYHNMKRMGSYCGHSRGIPISCQTEERMSHPAVVYFVQQWRGRIETTTSATKQASLRQIAELHLASNGPDKEAMHHPQRHSYPTRPTLMCVCPLQNQPHNKPTKPPATKQPRKRKQQAPQATTAQRAASLKDQMKKQAGVGGRGGTRKGSRPRPNYENEGSDEDNSQSDYNDDDKQQEDKDPEDSEQEEEAEEEEELEGAQEQEQEEVQEQEEAQEQEDAQEPEQEEATAKDTPLGDEEVLQSIDKTWKEIHRGVFNKLFKRIDMAWLQGNSGSLNSPRCVSVDKRATGWKAMDMAIAEEACMEGNILTPPVMRNTPGYMQFCDNLMSTDRPGLGQHHGKIFLHHWQVGGKGDWLRDPAVALSGAANPSGDCTYTTYFLVPVKEKQGGLWRVSTAYMGETVTRDDLVLLPQPPTVELTPACGLLQEFELNLCQNSSNGMQYVGLGLVIGTSSALSIMINKHDYNPSAYKRQRTVHIAELKSRKVCKATL
jgi:hypothetical protein